MASTLKRAELLRSHSEGYFLDRINRINRIDRIDSIPVT